MIDLGSRTNKVEVIKAASTTAVNIGIDHPSVEWLTQRGYTNLEVEAALIEANLNEEKALKHLYTSLTGNRMCYLHTQLSQVRAGSTDLHGFANRCLCL